ncbi:HAD family hydrolase [Synechococcus sp. CBW1004]|jgi:3-deoxy-D-manno-octulosonate 8-phosphate phosphatase (KDO 8-P phosphatase)|uniref:KdsC family phosphatase n=1 Tax=Synechococcus sp. CBW1004 TaxID=1353136 RepID=UPI0018CDA4C7|nr:HAD hydrolase family protein [Synechococcus sp. CBW1004]QPN62676.1 HAD hydrolase family protein [Synechococcus sp. CBW1004]
MLSSALAHHWRWWRHRRTLAGVRLIVLDVDGVLTDGGLWYGPEGELIKRFDVRDGLGIRLLQQAGIEVAFLSGGRGGATEVRASHLGIRHCLVGARDKPVALAGLQTQLGVAVEQTAFVGDDYNDLAVRSLVGLLVATADAARPLRRQADVVLRRPGGRGAVRELAERLVGPTAFGRDLRARGWRDRND